jgi:carbon monoxide dehydrogenase subunit G
MDVPRVVPCMPGAELVETVDENTWKARMRVKLGPISLSFLADVHRDEADVAARVVRLTADAREERGRGAATAAIESTLVEAGGRTRVETVTDMTLTGPAAQYGQRLAPDVAAQLVKSFAGCLEQQLAAPPAAAAADSPPPAPAPQQPVGGLSLGLRALAHALGRLVRRLLRRR